MDEPVEVAAALVFRRGQLLITQRHPEDHLGGLWEFPGGKRLPDETFEACLIRELREELDTDIEVGACFAEVDHVYPEKRVRLRFYLCRWLCREPRAVDCQAVRWIHRESLSDFEFPPADAQLLIRLRQRAELWT